MFGDYLFWLEKKILDRSIPFNPHLVMWGLVEDLYSSIFQMGGIFDD